MMSEIGMQAVQSSNIMAIGHDAESQVLRVEFNTGAVYEYAGVSQAVFDALVSAPSVGRYFAENIKGVYGYQKVS